MTTLPIQLHDGHVLIETLGNIILVDTGSPVTIHTQNTFLFLGKSYPCTTNHMGVTSESLSALLGTPITTLLGMDVLSKYKVLFHYRANYLGFSEEQIPMKGYPLELQNFMKIPIVNLEVAGKKRRMFLDSGAKLSYLTHEVTRGLPSQGEASDFYPGYGEFRTSVYALQSSISEMHFEAKYGNLPAQLSGLLAAGNVDGIIGFDLFHEFQVMLDVPGNVIQFGPG